jgi:HPr kinase/phosphorylase
VKQKTVHATLVKMMTRGIVLMGESGSGKSRLALSLLYEGARLVADDVVELFVGPDGLKGRAPDRLRGLIEIRGVGIIDVTAAFGRPFVLEEAGIDLVVRLVKRQDKIRRADTPHVTVVEMLGWEIPEIRIGSNIDARGLLCVVSDVILGGSTASTRITGLIGIPRY